MENERELASRLTGVINAGRKGVFYSGLFSSFGSSIDTVTSIEQFRALPFTTKKMLQERSPFDFLATPYSRVRRMNSSSATKGVPTVVFSSESDLASTERALEYCFRNGGLVPGDVFQTMAGFGLFSGGLAFQRAAERYGMTAIPAGPGNTARQVHLLSRFKVNGFHTISSYLPILRNYLRSQGIDPKKEFPHLKSISIGAEPLNPSLKEDLSEFFGVPVLNVYGLSEVGGPGVAAECVNGHGMHILSDHFFCEVIDPETQQSLPPGEEGELVITTLDRECMPLIRFRTGDVTRLFYDPDCCDGRYPLKMDYVNRRVDDMIIVKGVNIFPAQVQEILLSYKEVIHPFFQLIVEPGDALTLLLSPKTGTEVSDKLENRIKRDIKNWLSVSVAIEWKEDSFFMSPEGKAKLIIDKR